MHSVKVLSKYIGICTCGEGFSGANVKARLEDHIAHPDPNSLGAQLIKALV